MEGVKKKKKKASCAMVYGLNRRIGFPVDERKLVVQV